MLSQLQQAMLPQAAVQQLRLPITFTKRLLTKALRVVKPKQA
jgi:hypothetical protein